MGARLLFVAHSGDYYGSSQSTLDLAKGLKGLGYDCRVLLPADGRFAAELNRAGISIMIRPYQQTFIPTGGYPVTSRVRRVARRFFTAWRLRHDVREFDPQIIYSITSAIDLGFILSRILRLPHIWHVREYLGLHNGLSPDTGKWLLRSMLGGSSHVFFNSRTVMEHYRLKNLGKSFVYNGLFSSGSDLAKYRYSGKSGRLRIGFVGALVPSKGVFRCIETVKLLASGGHEIVLHLFGDSSDQKTKETILAEKEVEIVMEGFVTSKDLIYDSFDILLMLSNFEAFGRATAEAMAYGKLVVGISNGATPELISHGETGLLVQSGDPEEILDVLLPALKEPEQINKMTLKAQSYALRNFNTEQYVDVIAQKIPELLPGQND